MQDLIEETQQQDSDPFGHITPAFRAKVAKDFLDHLDGDKWDLLNFDHENDYQRHLYALFLKISGKNEAEIWAALPLCTDIKGPQTVRSTYIDTVIHSEIVGFNYPNGTRWSLPTQHRPSCGDWKLIYRQV